MPYIYARHVVADYDRWERHHEANAETRAAHGSVGSTAYRPRDRPSSDDGDPDDADHEEVVVIQEVAEGRLAEALAYYDSEAFEETLAEAGVVEVVEARVLERVHEADA